VRAARLPASCYAPRVFKREALRMLLTPFVMLALAASSR
jgi:hypothetical protein